MRKFPDEYEHINAKTYELVINGFHTCYAKETFFTSTNKEKEDESIIIFYKNLLNVT